MSTPPPNPLPESLQNLVNADEEEREEYGDFENSWTSTYVSGFDSGSIGADIRREAQPNTQDETDQGSSKTEPSTGVKETESESTGQEGQC